MGHQRREQAATGHPVGAEFVADLDRRTVSDHSQHQAFLGKEAKFVREGSAGNARKHGFHFVEPSRSGDVEGGEDFDGPSGGEDMEGFHRSFHLPFGIVGPLVGVLSQ